MEGELLRLEIDQMRRELDDGRDDRKTIRAKVQLLSDDNIKTGKEVEHLTDSVDKLEAAINKLSDTVERVDRKFTASVEQLSIALARSSSNSMKWSLAVAGPLLTAAIVILGVIR